jgi:hypothetical protein
VLRVELHLVVSLVVFVSNYKRRSLEGGSLEAAADWRVVLKSSLRLQARAGALASAGNASYSTGYSRKYGIYMV